MFFFFSLLTSTNCSSAASFTSRPTITVWMSSVANVNQKNGEVSTKPLNLNWVQQKEMDWLSLMESPGVALTLAED